MIIRFLNSEKSANTRSVIWSALLLIALFLFINECVYARAGGAGGGDFGGGGGDDDLIGIAIHILMLLPFPYNIIVIGFLVFLFYISKKKVRQQSVYNKMQMPATQNRAFSSSNTAVNIAGFDETAFKNKVNKAFMQIQQAWQQQDIGSVRKFITDGVYQRFITQFKMMQLLGQTNTLNALEVHQIAIIKVEKDGVYDIIHTAISASVNDSFVSSKYPELNSGGYEQFIEYWCFIRKKTAKQSDLYGNDNCPNCGAALPHNSGEVSRCPYCKTITNLGDYDWVLSEITQADDFNISNLLSLKMGGLNSKLNAMFANDMKFSSQMIEDKVSNGYLQIQTAFVLSKPQLVKRFVSKELYDKLAILIPQNQAIYYRIFLNDVTLVGAGIKDNKHILMVAVKCSYQRIIPLDNGGLQVLDAAIISKTEVVYLERNVEAAIPQGSLYAHDCPSCGAPLQDTVDLVCSYCGAEINSPQFEWIIADIKDIANHKFYSAQFESDEAVVFSMDKYDSLYDVRDYALNNILIIIAADGVFEQSELEFAQKLASKWGYSNSKIQPLLNMAKNKQLVIRMPEDTIKQKKILKLMHKAAKIDKNFCKEEQQIINNISQYYNITL